MKFAGLSFEESVCKKAQELTQSEEVLWGGFNPERARNASVNVDSWRIRLPMEHRLKIEVYPPCQTVIEALENQMG